MGWPLDKVAAAGLDWLIMARETQRLWLTFDGESSRKPLIYEMGDREEIKKAVAWLEVRGVQVEPVEINTIEG
jgi:hypothetical protein